MINGWPFPARVSEHAAGNLPPLLDALRPTPETCTMLQVELPAENDKPARIRRAILGPIGHYQQEPRGDQEDPQPEEHPYCPCCLLVKSFETFKHLIEGEGVYCLRLFAARDSDGTRQADCRVNGLDWEAGAEALRKYATTWPPAGYEFRKQHVVLQREWHVNPPKTHSIRGGSCGPWFLT